MGGVRELLDLGARGLGIRLDEQQIGMFMSYMDLLKEWNKRINLTSITDDEGIVIKHFIDSLTCAATGCVSDGVTAIDMGTGAGFPGIPIKIAFPGMRLVLADSLKKRTEFLTRVTDRLGLGGVSVIHGRAEDLARSKHLRESFSLCLSRAVAHLSVLSEYCIPFLMQQGVMLAMKGPGYLEELEESGRAISELGGEVSEVKQFVLPGTDICRYIVVIKKSRATPSKYPRKAGMPTKKPLRQKYM